MVVLASGEKLTLEDVPEEITGPGTGAAAPAPAAPPGGAGTTLAEAEKAQILAAIAAYNGNKSRAAEALGISRRTMHRKLNEWNMK